MILESKQLKDFLVDTGLVTKTEYADIENLVNKGKIKDTPEKVLVSQGKISEDDLRRAQAYVFGIPFVDLKNQKIDLAILSLIPEPLARKNNIVAFKKNIDSLEVAMLDINDLSTIEFITKKVGLKVLPRLTDSASIKSVILSYQKILKEKFGDLMQEADMSTVKNNENFSVLHTVEILLKHSILQSASDIHIEIMENDVLVRYRIDGILHDAMKLPKNIGQSIKQKIKFLAKLDMDEEKIGQEGKFKIDIDGEIVLFKVSTIPTYFGEKIVIQPLKENTGLFSLESIGFYGENLEIVHKAIKQASGMILVSGPSASGKTTTLYTILELLNSHNVNIATIENPIEYQISRINQTEVNKEIGFTFPNAIRSVLKQDPDIIMVGEISDDETASLSLHAALTGHMIIASINTNSVAKAISKMIDSKIEPRVMASAVNIIIGQRIIRKLGKNKEKYFLSKEELVSLGKIVNLNKVLKMLKSENVIDKNAKWENIHFYRAKQSNNSIDGYEGRTVLREIIKITPSIKNLILNQVDLRTIQEEVKKDEILSIVEDGIFKCVAGITTIDEVLDAISE